MKKTISKYSFGIGDRFAHQGEAQLSALIQAADLGVEFIPVWNKSNREHTNVNSTPNDVRVEADKAVRALNWEGQYFVDADHINLSNVDWFMDSSNFFTIDVAEFIGKEADDYEVSSFLKMNEKYLGELLIPGIDEAFIISKEALNKIAEKFLFAIKEASVIYKYIEKKKGKGNFVSEVSMDEVDDPQSPVELFFILSALSLYSIPLQTLAPKFTGRFNKGVDYVGDLELFKKEFKQDLLVVDFAITEFDLPENLKLSIHSGSDKFSIYPIIGEMIRKYDKGIHIKTAGTTWLEELIGLAIASSESLLLVKEIYYEAYERIEELAIPYATVIDIDVKQLPRPDEVRNWSGEKFANTLRHIPNHPDYNLNFRQLLHVAYKLAANRGSAYTDALRKNKQIVAKQVTENIFERHIKRLFKTVK